MATLNYKSFSLNSPGDTGPWSTVEQQVFKDLVDTLVTDCVTATKDTTNGHQHKKLYNTSSNVSVRTQAQGSLRFEYDSSNYLGLAVDSSGNATITPTGTTLDVAGYLGVTRTDEQLRLKYDSDSYCSFTVDSGGDITMTPSGTKATVADEKYLYFGSNCYARSASDTLYLAASTGTIDLSSSNISVAVANITVPNTGTAFTITNSTVKFTIDSDGDVVTEGTVQLKDDKTLILGDDSDATLKFQSSIYLQTVLDLTANSLSRGLRVDLGTDSAAGVTVRKDGAPALMNLFNYSVGAPTSGTILGKFSFGGWSGYQNATSGLSAYISAVTADDWATNDFPSELQFFTTRDSASSAVKTAGIDKDGKLYVYNNENTATAHIYTSEYSTLYLGNSTSSSAVAVDQSGNIRIRVYAQTTEPTLTYDNFMAIWKDTDDSDRIYLVFRRGSADQVKVELL